MRPYQRGATLLRRALLLAASVGLAASGWFLLGESDSASLAETASPSVLARVHGVDITEDEVTALAAAELAALARRRHQLLVETARSEVHRRILAAEAEKRGLTLEELLAAEAPPGDAREPGRNRYGELIAQLEASYGVEYLIEEPFGVETATTEAARSDPDRSDPDRGAPDRAPR